MPTSFARALPILATALAISSWTDRAAAGIEDAIAIEVLSGWRADGDTHLAALSVRLGEGWRTYWRSAGTGGISPRIDWETNGPVADVAIHWPTPTVFALPHGRSIGYDRDFVLPLEVALRGGGVAVLAGIVDMGVCREICLPVRIEVSVELPAGGLPDPRIEAAIADGPTRIDAAVDCRLTPVPGGTRLRVEIAVPPLGPSEEVVIEASNPSIWITDAEARREGGHLVAQSDLVVADGSGIALSQGDLDVAIFAAGRVFETPGCGG